MSSPTDSGLPPPTAHDAVFVRSVDISGQSPIVRGYDFNKGNTLDGIMESMLTTGFQSTNLGKAVAQINSMIDWRLSDEPITENTDDRYRDEKIRGSIGTKIFLGYTSNLVSSGTREQIRYLVEHRCVDVLVTTAGGVEEDLIKCLGNTYVGDFKLPGKELRAKGLNRIDWIIPILDDMLKQQQNDDVIWTPSKMIDTFGKKIDDETSICYWAHKNQIPIFCPAITDGSIGDMLYFHSFKNPGLICDLVGDIRLMNNHAIYAKPRKTGIIILGGGLPKHHICNANMMRNGADFAVYVNTAQEFDGSDSGAYPDEAVSWGKIRGDATPVKISGEVTILFPLIVSQTFAKKIRPAAAAAATQ